MAQRYWLMVLCLCFRASLANAQTAENYQPYTVLVYDENWRYLRDPLRQVDWSDKLKYIRLLGDSDETYFSFGGQVRERGEYFDHPGWGSGSPDNGYILQRYMAYFDLHLGRRFRLFVQAKSGLEVERDGGPRPGVDEDRLDWNQGFVDWAVWTEQPDHEDFTVRAGRQMMTLGAGRLIAIGAGLNVEQVFDGVRLTLQTHGWTTDAFATRPVTINNGLFDDAPNHAVNFWGLYVTHRLPLLKLANVDLYYLGLDNKSARWNAGIAREQRQTAGVRVFARSESWYYDWEYTTQFGRFGAGSIGAWGIATNTGYRFKDAHFSPRIELDAGALSGGANPRDHTLGTFNALFPNGSYLGQALLLGPYNLVIARPKLRLDLTRKLSLNPNLEFLWRESTADGSYGPAGNLTRAAGSSQARYVGAQADLELDYNLDRHTTFAIDYVHFLPGKFLKQMPPGLGVNFIAPQVTYTF